MELNINKLILERDSYQKKISNLISKIDNCIGLSDSFSNKRNDNNNLKIKKNNNNFKLSKLRQELNDLHTKYELGKKEEENSQYKSQQTQNNLITVRLKFVSLKTQYRFLKDYNCQIGQYLSEQNKTTKELADNCLKLKEKIENGKLYSNPTQEEEKLLQQNEEIEQYDQKIKELENLIVKQEQNKRIYKIRYEELQKILNNKNGRSSGSKKGLYYNTKRANYKRISSARESNNNQGSNRKMKLLSSFTKQAPIAISTIIQKETNVKQGETERPRLEENRRRQFNQLNENKENNFKHKQDTIEKKEIKKEEQINNPEKKIIISNNKENKLGWLDDDDNNDVVEELDENKNNPISTIDIKTNQNRRRPFGNFGFSSP